jgi:hypothetical protein
MASGLDDFLNTLHLFASETPPGKDATARFVARLGEECAYIRLSDIRHPLRFLRQMAGAPPRRFGVSGFNPALVDDANPVRHYVAFVVVGFWLPWLLGMATLYAWEIAGFVRYRGVWSPRDVASGKVGLRHGRRVRRDGHLALPELVRRDLAAPTQHPL